MAFPHFPNLYSKLLYAMWTLNKNSQKDYHISEITVGVWQLFPSEFGLEHYQTMYPDKGKVSPLLMRSESGLLDRGLVSHERNNTYIITDLGIETAEAVYGDTEIKFIPDRVHKLSQRDYLVLEKMFHSKAFDLYTRKEIPEKIHLGHVLRFYGSHLFINKQRRAFYATCFHNSLRLLKKKFEINPDPIHINETIITESDFLRIVETHTYLWERFEWKIGNA